MDVVFGQKIALRYDIAIEAAAQVEIYTALSGATGQKICISYFLPKPVPPENFGSASPSFLTFRDFFVGNSAALVCEASVL